jgi:hypothetical protein
MAGSVHVYQAVSKPLPNGRAWNQELRDRLIALRRHENKTKPTRYI